MTEIHYAEDAIERGEGICRTCLSPIWNEGGEVGGIRHAEGWSDRIKRGGDSLVCFKALAYRHEPLTGREAAIYDFAYRRGWDDGDEPITPSVGRSERRRASHGEAR